MENLITTANIKIETSHLAHLVNERFKDILSTNWGQKWTRSSPTRMGDQYGFEIELLPGEKKTFILYRNGHQVCPPVNRLTTAKLISCIILNDIVMFTPLHKVEPAATT